MHARHASSAGAPVPPAPRVRPSAGSHLEELMNHPLLFAPVRAPRHPIVLCHGLYGFDVRGPFLGLEYHYWYAALDVLRKRIGAVVHVYGVPPTGSIEERAAVLHARLRDPMRGVCGQPVNFVGHSMGGLDARYVISKICPSEYHPVSLTTIATPHHGSPFMDWCNANIGIGMGLVNQLTGGAGRADGGALAAADAAAAASPPASAATDAPQPASSASRSSSTLETLTRAINSVSSALSTYILSAFDQPAYAMLSTRYMAKLFNPQTPNVDGVRYFSVAARHPSISVLNPLWLPQLILNKAAESNTSGGEADGSSDALGSSLRGNDGLVSVRSAQWGTFLGVMEGWDHWDVRGPGGTQRIRAPPPPEGAGDAGDAPKREKRSLASRVSGLGQLVKRWIGKKRPAPPPPEDVPEWNWLDAVLAQYPDTEPLQRPGEHHARVSPHAAAHALASFGNRQQHTAQDADIAVRVADWIASHLPKRVAPDAAETRAAEKEHQHDSRMLLLYLAQPQQQLSLEPPAPAPDVRDADKGLLHAIGHGPAADALRHELGLESDGRSKDAPQPSPGEPPRTTPAGSSSATAMLLDMFPFLVNGGQDSDREPTKNSEHAFERFWVAICRNLYEQGL
ncbi:triacylglycerol lipase [Malassezia sp. CBS 17886]|nr:triacylglycerol lipase [Malassezia sp. CBS 17886]